MALLAAVLCRLALASQVAEAAMRKHLGWYCKGFPYAAAMRGLMVRAVTSDDVARIVAEFHTTVSLSSGALTHLSPDAPLPSALSCA